jgi:PAS domain S-box-containing protein
MNECVHGEWAAAELQDRVTELIDQQTAISEVLRAIVSSPHDLQPIFDAILDNATRLCRADVGTLRLSEERGLRRVAMRGDSLLISQAWSTFPGLAEKGSHLSRIATSRLPTHVPDLTALEGDYRDDLRIAAVNAGVRTGLVVPLLKGHEIVGIISLGRKQVRPFTDRQISLCGDFAAQATIALEGIRRERQYREALRRSETYLAEAQRLSHTGSAAYNQTELIYMSDEASRIYGFDPLQGIPSREAVWRRIHPDDAESLNEKIEQAVRERRGFAAEHRVLLPDGMVKHLEVINDPVFSASGELQEIMCTGFDVTERKRAEQTLRESEAKFRDYAETASDWFWEIGPDYKFTLLTENAFGAPAAHRLGTPCWDHALDLETEPEKWRLIFATLDSRKSFRDFVYRGLSGNGSPMYVRASGKPVFDANGEFRGYRGTGTDITALRKVETEARESEQRYRKAQLELEHANRVATLGQLTSSIAHEVNQPITAAVTYALAARRYLSAEPPNFHEVDDALSLIVKEGSRAAEVVSRIRALFKKAPARKDAVAINDAILEIIALTRTEAANNSVLVRTQLTEGLPRLQGDRVQLQQVLLNLIINAIEAMRDVGEEERELLISTRREPDGVSVEVRDSGPGFAPEALESVFEPFYTTKPEGMGMGLSICRSIIEAHGGRLWAIPSEPQGALFQFTIPAD